MAAGPFLVDPYRLPIGRGRFHTWDTEDAAASDEALASAGAARNIRLATISASGDTDEGPPADPVVQIERLLQAVGPTRALVFWFGGATLTAKLLYRQLRTMDKVLIPRGWSTTAAGEGGSLAQHASDETFEAVLFRHADGDVLAGVLPVLDERQFGRLFGPADGVLFLAPSHPGPSGAILYRSDLSGIDPRPDPQPGMMRLTHDQMRAIERGRLALLRRPTTDYILNIAPEHADRLGEVELRRRVDHHLGEGYDLGIRSDASLKRWCMMEVTSDGAIGQEELVRDYMTTPRLSASDDVRVRHVLRRLLELRRAAGEAWT